MKERKELLMCEELENVKAPANEQYWNGFTSGIGAAGVLGGVVMGAIITFATT